MEMTYEVLVAECKRLRALHERAEAEFFLFLMRVEREHEAVWKEAGCETFDQFLRSNNLTEVGRYRFFAIGVDRTSVDEALANGAPWTVIAGRKPDASPAQLDSFRQQAAAFVEVHATAPSEKTTREWEREVFGHRGGGIIRKVDELNSLREENRRLKAELAAARSRIAELEAAATGVPKKKGKKVA